MNDLVVGNNTLGDFINKLSETVKNGDIKSYTISHSQNQQTVTVDTQDNRRHILSLTEVEGYKNKSETVITEMSVNERRNVVEKLYDDGMTQQQIATRTRRSQKTISNDIRAIKNK